MKTQIANRNPAAALTDEQLSTVTGGRAGYHVVEVPEAAAPKVFELVVTGKAPGLRAVQVR